MRATGRVLALALCAWVGLAFPGCDSEQTEPPRTTTTVAKLPPGPTLRLALPDEPSTLDPALAADLPSLNVTRHLFSGLTRIVGTKVEPDLAESWDVSGDGRVWTFFLREGLQWSDGRPLTAEDFEYGWLRALARETESSYARVEMLNIAGARAYRNGSGRAEDVGVQAVDERTLEVRLRHAVPWLDEQVAYPVFSPRPREQRGSVTNGPFRLEERRGRRLVLRRSRSYWNAASVGPERLVLQVLPVGAAQARFAAGSLDGILPAGFLGPGFPWIQAEPPDSRALRTDRGYRRLSTLSVQYLWFATKHPPLDDARVRRALSLALDRRALVPADGRPLSSVIPSSMPGFERLQTKPAPDPAEARRLLKESARQRRRLVLAFTSQDPRAQAVATAIKSDLARIEVPVMLAPVPDVSQLRELAGPPVSPRVDLVLLGWRGEFRDAYNFLDLFPCTSGLNVAGWCDKSFDRLMSLAVKTLDDRGRHRLERMLEEHLTGPEGAFPAAPLYTATDRVLLRPGLEGFAYSPLGFYELRDLRVRRR